MAKPSIAKRIRQAQADSSKHRFFRQYAFMVYSKGRCRKKVTAESVSNAVQKIFDVLYEATHHAIAESNKRWIEVVVENASRGGRITAERRDLPLVFDRKYIPVAIAVLDRSAELPSDQPLAEKYAAFW